MTFVPNSADSEFYALHQDRSQLLTDKDALQLAYESLMQTYNTLKEDHVSSVVRKIFGAGGLTALYVGRRLP